MAGLLDTLRGVRGQDPDEEKAIKRRSQEFEQSYGNPENAPSEEEPGIEPDEVTEQAVMLPFMGPASGMAKRAGSFAVQQGVKSGIKKLQEQPPPPPVNFGQGRYNTTPVRDTWTTDVNKLTGRTK